MDDYGRAHLLSEMDRAVVRIGQSTAHIAAREERICASKERDEDTAGSEKFLAILRECRRLHQIHYDALLLKFDRLNEVDFAPVIS
jgi:hypothetical protein